MKILKIICVILIAAVCFPFLCGCDPVYGSVEISSNSYYDRMIIKDGKVYLLCYLEFESRKDYNQIFDVTAMSEEDEENGLLKDRGLKLYIFNAESLSDVNEDNIAQLIEPARRISISGRETMGFYGCFVGEHGGGTQKHDRELPDNITVAARAR